MQSTNDRAALQTIRWLANLGNESEIAEFVSKNSAYSPTFTGKQVVDLRDEVRKLWRGDERANEIARDLFFGIPTIGQQILSRGGSAIQVDWKRGGFIFSEADGFRYALYLLLKSSHLLRVCAYAGCKEPYFIASRKIRRYCGPECAEAVTQETQRDYWKRCGSMRRRKRLARKKRK